MIARRSSVCNRRVRHRAALAGLVSVLISFAPAHAQKVAAPVSAPATLAKLFDEICYSSMPDFAPVIARAKSEKWTPITGKALESYRPSAKTDTLKAWSFEIGGKSVRVALSSSPVDAPMAEILPAFAKGRAYACSLVLPGANPQTTMMSAMKNVVGRDPDETYAEPPWTVDFWSGITNDLAALLYHYRPKSSRPGGLFSFIVLKK